MADESSDLSSRFRTKTKVWKRVLKWHGLPSPFLYFSLVHILHLLFLLEKFFWSKAIFYHVFVKYEVIFWILPCAPGWVASYFQALVYFSGKEKWQILPFASTSQNTKMKNWACAYWRDEKEGLGAGQCSTILEIFFTVFYLREKQMLFVLVREKQL